MTGVKVNASANCMSFPQRHLRLQTICRSLATGPMTRWPTSSRMSQRANHRSADHCQVCAPGLTGRKGLKLEIVTDNVYLFINFHGYRMTVSCIRCEKALAHGSSSHLHSCLTASVITSGNSIAHTAELISADAPSWYGKSHPLPWALPSPRKFHLSS